MKLSKFGFNLCAQYSRHRVLQTKRREYTIPPRDTEGDLPDLRDDLRKEKEKKRHMPQPYASPRIMRTPPTNPDKVTPQDATKKFTPMPDLAQYMTYFDLLKGFRPILHKYVTMMPKYEQFHILWKKFKHS